MPTQPEQTSAPQAPAPPPAASVAAPPNTANAAGGTKGSRGVDRLLLFLVIVLSADELGRLFIPASAYDWGIEQFYRYIVRTNYMVIDPYGVNADHVVVQKVAMKKPGFIVIREYSSCGELEYTWGHSRYLFAGEFNDITIPLGGSDPSPVSIQPKMSIGKKLAVELYEDDGDQDIHIDIDKKVVNWFGKPIITNIIIR